MWFRKAIFNLQERLVEPEEDRASSEELLRTETEHRKRRTVRNLRNRLEALDRRLEELQRSA